MTRSRRLLWMAAILLATAFGGWRYASGSTHPHTPDAIKAMRFAPYAPQKVVYHVTEGAGPLGRFLHGRYRSLLQTARNHVDAVGPGRLDLRILLQGDGLELLEIARHDANLAARIDGLKRDGVRFLICRNTVMGHDLDPATALYGVTPEDIVPAGIAEAASLVQQGYVYLKPLG